MTTNLVNLARAQVTPEVVQRASALVGESPASTQRAMETATPTIVGALVEKASTVSGASHLIHVLEEAGLTGTMAGLPDRQEAERGALDTVIVAGKDLLERVFGARVGSLVDATASSSGVKRSSMDSLLGLATPLVFGTVGSEISVRKLDAAGLATFLAEQRSNVVRALPSGVAAAAFAESQLPSARVAARPGTGAASPPRVMEPAQRRIPWVLLVAIPLALLVGYALRHRAPARTGAPEAVVLPSQAPSPMVGEGTASEQLARFLATPGGNLPQRFVLDNLNFDFATARLARASSATLDSVAEVLKQHPSAMIVLEGHTDALGDPVGNQYLSQQRADAVKAALVDRGVAPERIRTAGMGQDRPIAPNDTEERRAKNRRTEIVVVQR